MVINDHYRITMGELVMMKMGRLVYYGKNLNRALLYCNNLFLFSLGSLNFLCVAIAAKPTMDFFNCMIELTR